MAAPTHPCPDCETGACPCGVTCSGCDFTGRCSTCGGSGAAEGAAPPRVNWSLPNKGSTGHRWGKKPPMPECEGCGRTHRYDTPYYRLSPEEVLRHVSKAPVLRNRPRCTICCVPFGSTKSRWYQVARARCCITPGTFGKTRL